MSLLPDPLAPVRRRLRHDFEATVGRHDEEAIYGGPAGDPGLVGGPGSVSWRLHADTAVVALAGPAAILMEVLEPSVMAGVEEHSTYRQQPLRRAKTTFGYVMQTTFGNTEAATAIVERVKRIHGRVEGVRPDGVPYRALDPDLIAWVHTCIPWAIMTAYDRYRRPLDRAEKDRYLREQATIGRMGGAEWVPESVDELEAFVEQMRPRLAMNDQTRSFVDFLTGDLDPDTSSALELYRHRLDLQLSMSLMPTWARRVSGTWHHRWFQTAVGDPVMHTQAALIRWGIGSPPCVAMARARAEASSVPGASSGRAGPSRSAEPPATAASRAGRAGRAASSAGADPSARPAG